MASQNQVSIYLSGERLNKVRAIQDELKRRSGVAVSRNAVICRAIDDLFLLVCLPEKTNDTQAIQGKQSNLIDPA